MDAFQFDGHPFGIFHLKQIQSRTGDILANHQSKKTLPLGMTCLNIYSRCWRVPRLVKSVRLFLYFVYFCCVKKAQLTQISVFPDFQWFSMDHFNLSNDWIWNFWAFFICCYSMKRWASFTISPLRELMKRAIYFRALYLVYIFS